MTSNKNITSSVRDEMFHRIIDEEKSKNQKQGIFGQFFLNKANQFMPKCKGWIHLCL